MKKKLLAILIPVVAVVVAAVIVLVCCLDKPEPEKPVNYQAIDDADVVSHKSTESVYDKIGSGFTIDKVSEDANGVAWATVDGVKYELGMDFLSMAMVYNCTPAGKFTTEDAVYNEWWKLYIQRWNMMVPEVPLYSNQYFDLYNAKFQGFVTSPYWAPADAIVATSVKAGASNSAILGSSTDLSGAFRNSSWGKSSPSSSDQDVQNLVSGYSTVMSDMSGSYKWNFDALAEEPTKTNNADGTLSYTIKVRDDLVFSDGSFINAKNFVAGLLANSSPVGKAAGGTGLSGQSLVGFDAFKAFDGTNGSEEGVSQYFEGIQLLDEYTFKVTFGADYAGYYYSITYAGFSPDPLALYLGANGDIITDEDGHCGLNSAFYAKSGDTYTTAAEIKANLEWDSDLPYSGPYTVFNWDETTLTATLKLNPKYPGEKDFRGKASIETITYIKVEDETQMSKFEAGEVDVIAGITGGDETKKALKLCEDHPDLYAETHYDRAGYGKLAFRCDFGPAGMAEVRQAIMYTINRDEFAQTFTGGFGSVVHGPYYEGFGAFQANKNTIKLNKYSYSKDSANEVLDAAGWTYTVEGKKYNGKGIRYKKLSGYELSKDNLHYASTDGKYKTVKIDGEYYMPLAINWFGTQPNSVTDQLVPAWQNSNTATKDIGMYITYTSSDFTTAVYGEYCHYEEYGFTTNRCSCVNFATGFNSAAYDFAYNWSISPDYYDYSNNYLFDEADYAENYAK